MQKLAQVDDTWTLFLDRDGVINERVFGGYVLKYSDFHFKEGVLTHAKNLFARFAHVIVVTNQQCVAKGLLSKEELELIHDHMKEDFVRVGAKVSAVYAALERKGEAPFVRKPHATMAQVAKREFPEIDFAKSIMVGDTDGDIQFGKNLGMKTVLIQSEETIHEMADVVLSSLADLIDVI
jgi:histidinol-phosphate phosphatase family protein